MSKARTLATVVSDSNVLADGAVAASEVSGLATVATSGAAADVTGLANVATTGSYNDLSSTPTPYTNGKAIAMATIFGF